MIGVYWGGVNRITIGLYALIIIFLPFSPAFSTILLFGLVSFWSRLPGVGIPVIGWWFLILDTVDIFSLLIAVHISGFAGAVFSVLVNLGSGAIGKYTNWNVVIKDAIGQFIICLIIPFIHSITGNIFVSIVWYTLLRAFMFIPMRFFYAVSPLPKFLFELTVGTILLTMVNVFYGGIFGGLFEEILQEGMRFNWTLFFIVTALIGGSWFYFKKMKISKGPPQMHDYG